MVTRKNEAKKQNERKKKYNEQFLEIDNRPKHLFCGSHLVVLDIYFTAKCATIIDYGYQSIDWAFQISSTFQLAF